jgi:serine/threonine protein kinase
MKTIDKNALSDEKNPALKNLRYQVIRSEGDIMQKCNSDCIVRIYDRYETDDYIILVLEYCNGGDLADTIHERGRIP